MKLHRIIPALCAGLLLVLHACAPATKAPEQVPAAPDDAELVSMLAGRVWVAERIHGRPVVDMSHTSMVFTTDGRVSGRGGCNSYTGSYSLDNGVISFPPMAATMRMCAPALEDQETRFFRSLSEPQAVSFQNGLLYLTPSGGEPSVFAEHVQD